MRDGEDIGLWSWKGGREKGGVVVAAVAVAETSWKRSETRDGEGIGLWGLGRRAGKRQGVVNLASTYNSNHPGDYAVVS
jgi:hypothetical protein